MKKEEWQVVRSKSDAHPQYGFPFGEMLFRTLEEALEFVKKSGFKDLYIKGYNE